MKKFIKQFIKSVVIFVLFLFFLPFLISPVYDFPTPTPFSGEKLYNPYQNIDSTLWKKGNFQIQSLAWGGYTDGSNNPTDSIDNIYKKLGYDVIGISDYMKINVENKGQIGYLPIYEHGYNFRKTHQVSIGAKSVFWLDFPFYQTTSQKQFIINQLKSRTEVLAIVHPDFSLEGYSHNDLKYLVNYDLLEALNHQKFSLSHWDAALSNGHAKFILANDDGHDILNPYLIGVVATFLNTQTVTPKNIMNALTSGKSYGYTPYTPDNDTYAKKAERTHFFPNLKSAQLVGNEYTVEVSKTPIKISFIGQGGKVEQETNSSKVATYNFKPNDTYIRVEVDYGRDEKMYLNPVFKYNGDNAFLEGKATVNYTKSILLWIFSYTFFGAILFFIIKKF